MRHVVIMAGGSGQRFWPLSRESYPKQFLTLYGNRSLLQYSYQRARHIVPPHNIYISTRSGLETTIRKQIPSLGKDRLIVEPVGRDTGPSIALTCLWIMRKDPEATVMLLPADHYINPTNRFTETAKHALRLAEKTNSIVIVGIRPTIPSTAYGYIQCDLTGGKKATYEHPVLSFREKPDLATAKQYLMEGNYFWNSGIFVAKASVMMEQIQDHAPEIFKLARLLLDLPVSRFRARLKTVFSKMPKISFDYAVMEKSKSVVMVEAKFEWNDLGSWSSLDELPGLLKDENILMGKVLPLGSKGNIVSVGKKLAVLIDVKDLVVALTDDALLVCHKESAQKVKQAVMSLKKGKYASYV